MPIAAPRMRRGLKGALPAPPAAAEEHGVMHARKRRRAQEPGNILIGLHIPGHEGSAVEVGMVVQQSEWHRSHDTTAEAWRPRACWEMPAAASRVAFICFGILFFSDVDGCCDEAAWVCGVDSSWGRASAASEPCGDNDHEPDSGHT